MISDDITNLLVRFYLSDRHLIYQLTNNQKINSSTSYSQTKPAHDLRSTYKAFRNWWENGNADEHGAVTSARCKVEDPVHLDGFEFLPAEDEDIGDMLGLVPLDNFDPIPDDEPKQSPRRRAALRKSRRALAEYIRTGDEAELKKACRVTSELRRACVEVLDEIGAQYIVALCCGALRLCCGALCCGGIMLYCGVLCCGALCSDRVVQPKESYRALLIATTCTNTNKGLSSTLGHF
jgi:hypothetical protein